MPLNIEPLPNDNLQVSWEGSGFKLTKASSAAGPYEDVLIDGKVVTKSPVVLAPSANSELEFYRLQSLASKSVARNQKQYDGSSGESMRYTYDAYGNRTSVTDANGHTTWFAYDEKGRLAFTTNALGCVTSNTYDAARNRISDTDAKGQVTWYASQNRLSFITNALGYVTAYAYDPVGNKIAETDADGHTITFSYDCLNRVVQRTDALGYVTRYEYDAGPGGGGGCGCGSATKGTGHIIKQTDANGHVTYFKYCPLGRLLTTIRKQGDTADLIDDDDAVTAYTYDPNGNRLTTATRMNATHYLTNWFGYDALNRPIASTNGAGGVTQTSYDLVGNVLTATAPNGNQTTNIYDSLNRLIQVDDKIGLVASYGYDAVGNLLSQADGNANTTQYAHDVLNRLVITTDAMGSTSTSYYDPVGNLLQVTDRMTNSTLYAYDALNRRTNTVDAIGCVTAFTYDGVGNLLAITDANSHTTRYEYDALNRKVKEIYPDLPGPGEPPESNKRFFTYDGVGNQTSRTDQKGYTTVYLYSDLNLLTNRSYVSDPSDRFTYDLAGRMLTASKTNWLTTNDWVVTFAYDGANRVTNTTQGGRVIAYAYDIPARIRSLTYPSGTNITETTDFRGRLLTVGDGALPPIATYTYDLGNRVLTRTYRNGVVAEYAYNPNNWISSVIHTNPAATNLIAGFTYAYDKEGNKLYEENLWNTNRSEAYACDPIYRLTNWLAGGLVGGTVPAPTNSEAWQLDRLGNWNVWITNGITQTRTHSQANEITSIDTNSIYHDPNGNLTNDGRYAYAYDQENRLVQVIRLFFIPGDTGTRLVGQYAYDALGRRVQKFATADPLGLPAATSYVHDAERLIEEQTLLGSTLATYTFGNYIDEVLTMVRAGQRYYHHPDALWTVKAVSDDGATQVGHCDYDAFGSPTLTDGTGGLVAPNPWGTPHGVTGSRLLFTGREFDEETGLGFYRARYYAYVLGRFLQRDPLQQIWRSDSIALVAPGPSAAQASCYAREAEITLVFANTRSYRPGNQTYESGKWETITTLNAYEYAAGNPSKMVDPLGLIACDCKLPNAQGKCNGPEDVGHPETLKCSGHCVCEKGEKNPNKDLPCQKACTAFCVKKERKVRDPTLSKDIIVTYYVWDTDANTCTDTCSKQ